MLQSLRCLSFIFLVSSFASPCLSLAADEKPDGLKSEAELGWIVTAGNSETNTFSVKDSSSYRIGPSEFRFDGRYLSTSAAGIETAKAWGLSLRYGLDLTNRLSAIASQGIEGNPFSGFLQRYNTDIGFKYILLSDAKVLEWFFEAGYRLINENSTTGANRLSQAARGYTELKKDLSETLHLRLWAEWIPNFSFPADWLFNTEVSGSAILSQTFSLKLGYLLKYDAQLNVGAIRNTDTAFTTALVAKF